jgi:hypothetical protein
MMSHLCNCCVREFLILARTWFAFGLPSKPGVIKEKKKNYRKSKGEAHIGKGWDSDCSSSDSDDEGLAASAFDKSSLFPNEQHTYLMAKEKKVYTRNTPKYTSLRV